MVTIEYQTPPSREHRLPGFVPYWLVFIGCLIPSFIGTSIFDDVFEKWVFGRYGDGGMTFLAAFIGVPVAMITAGVLRVRRAKRGTSILGGVVLGIAACPGGYMLAWLFFGLLARIS